MIIGLDVGGTHADAVLLSDKKVERSIKVPTDTSNLFNTVLTCFNLLLENIKPQLIQRVVISTTLTTNSVVQKNIDPVGIIVSAGPGIDPDNFRRGNHYYPVSGSIDHRGREIKPIIHGEIEAAAEKMKKDGIKYIGVIGKFSPRNPSHEITIHSILKHHFDTIFMGHKVSGKLNFPRRIATVYLNAAVFSMHKNFFNAVTDTLKQKGLTAPIQILKADGGTMNLHTSMEFPGQTILSGPAASVMGAIPHAPDDKDILVLDIGGTTTDLAVMVNKAPLLEPVGIGRGKHKSLIRALHTTSKGIGGDSEVTIKRGAIAIGPDRKGPAMAFGGNTPTPTDAMIYLGIMDAGDKSLAEKGMAQIASKLEISPQQAAEAIFTKTCSKIVELTRKMVERINSKPVYTVHEFLEGYKINPQQILLLGGPAPFMAARIEEISGIKTTVVPMSSVANAIGAALARTTCEISLLADTEQGIESAPEENYTETITRNYRKDDAMKTAQKLLEKKAIQSGAIEENLELELTEFQEFNIVRRFSLQGKIFRVKMQVKPGLIKGFSLAS
ncbi:Hydantoinase/oxoprolinase [Desulfamplus magnetovallimortis]|uniref:Hydantoinase/oxoprolinase n=1 Tax=Desulfamplus magnetovallimortis TaxID=1246637 RepID=A0A1W1HA80_9BACT|nr:hydantoinase/oxoprolinase family protein [Desulfamplus magnetovallimortis]SLM29278.1 Hydantoinase/oxoprolinase [Desulfamplus magnetovallimortis]